MGLDRLWPLPLGVAAAVLICLLRLSQGVDALVRARVGGRAELGCSLGPSSPAGAPATPNLFPLHVVEWVRLGFNVPILIKFGVYAPRVHPDYRGRVSLTRGASLLVEGLSLEDEGWFECRILLLDSAADDFRNGTWTFLSITAPPVFIQTPPAFVEVLQGDSLTLSCGAHGNPRPVVVWHKDETPIVKRENIKVLNGTLSLVSVTRETSGLYKCHVWNSEGNLTHVTQLQVKGPPIIIVSPEDTTLNVSQDALLQCQADAYPSNLTYEWWRRGENVHHIAHLKTRVKILVDGTLLIPDIIPEDTGDYTCTPTNGIMTPPSASAHLKVKHPARVGGMPRETYLPTGMEGVIVCPVQAEPALLYVNWTKDGDVLDLDSFPGWMVNSEGSVKIATANEDAVGVYTCTAFNSYGTMGPSDPTQVVLQDPPSFRVWPLAEYLQEAGRELLLPCEAHGDPAPNITWSKTGQPPRSPYTVLSNGSLLLRPLGKDHQGGWECRATNRVATVATPTVVLVLGTSPHAVSMVTVSTGLTQANVSWEPGFDGGYSQKFTVWVKQASRGKHEWSSLPVPSSQRHLLVTGLLPGTSYQLSVLPQNKHGSGPFSEITVIRTQAVPTEPPTVVTTLPILDPPLMLSANRTLLGVLLQWSPPEAPVAPLTGYLLQARRDQGPWVILHGSVAANHSQLLVRGLLRDSVYDLRLMSRSDTLLSMPSASVNVSTTGMEMYPLRPRFLEFVPESLLAGVLGGVCFLLVAIVLSLATACLMSHRRRRRRRKRREDLPSAFRKSPSSQARSPSDSPDSVLKLKLCPPLSFFPRPSSSSQSDRSSFDRGSRGGEYHHDQRRQLLSSSSSPPPHYTLFESHLGGGHAPSPPSALESISRGPDGRFLVQPLPEGSSPAADKKKRPKKDFLHTGGGGGGGRGSVAGSNRTSSRESPKSSSLSSDRGEEERRRDSPLAAAADGAATDRSKPPPSSPPPGRGGVKALARNLSRGCFSSDDEQGSQALLERASFYSDNSEKKRAAADSTRRHHRQGAWLPDSRERDRPPPPPHQPPAERESRSTDAGTTLMSQLDSSRLAEDSLGKRAQLAQERAEMERELAKYTSTRDGQSHEPEPGGVSGGPGRVGEEGGGWPPSAWNPHGVPLRHRPSGQTNRVSDYRRACYFGNTTSSPTVDRPPSSSHIIQWDISPVASITASLIPAPARRPLESAATPVRHVRAGGPAAEGSSPPVNSSRSPVTQCTSLSLLSPDVSSESPPERAGTPGRLGRAGSRSPEREPGGSPYACSTQEGVTTTTPTTTTTRGQPYPEDAAPYRRPEDRETSERDEQRETGNPSPSSYATLPYELHRGAKGAQRRDDPCAADDRRGSLSYAEAEREGVRARSRRSDKCLFGGDSPVSSVSPLTLLEEECERSDRLHFSVSGMSESFKTPKPGVAAPQPPVPRMSPVQTSAILEYLSLPGFIEMSVDEPPGDESELTVAAAGRRRSSALKPGGSSPVGELDDEVLEHWDARVRQKREAHSSQKSVSFEQPPSRSTKNYEKPEYSRGVEAKDSSLKVAYRDKQPLFGQTAASLERTQSRMGSVSAQTLFSTAKGTADSFQDRPESPSEHFQRYYAQGSSSRTNKIASRIYQAPVPFMKKSLSIGPCRTLSGMGQPRPFLKKSISLGSQKWEHFESLYPIRTYVSERCYWDEFPYPDVRVKSYSLGRSPCSFPRPGPSWRESVSARQPSWERPRPRADRPPTGPSYLTVSVCPPPRQTAGSARRELADPRRQATAFPDASGGWPTAYRDVLQSAQHKYVPVDASVPQYPQRSGSRGPPDMLIPHYPARPSSRGPQDTSIPHYPPRPSSRGPQDISIPHYPPRPSSRGPPDTSIPHFPPRPSSRGPQDTSIPHFPARPSSRGPQDTSIPHFPPRPSSRGPQDTSVPHFPPRPSSRGPQDTSIPHFPPRPSSRGPPDSREPPRVPPRSYLPRMYSWPSPSYHASMPPGGDVEPAREGERGVVVVRGPPDAENRDGSGREGGRASYASLSSGRGSVGLLRQSLSVTPTLLSSPETTEEGERHGGSGAELRERRAQRRNTSVDESYEWDSADVCADEEVLEASRLGGQTQTGGVVGVGGGRAAGGGGLRHDRPRSAAAGLQDLHRKGPPPPVSPPAPDPPPRPLYGRSLSDARFNALRLEYQEYRRSQEDPPPPLPPLPPSAPPDYDSDCSSALL